MSEASFSQMTLSSLSLRRTAARSRVAEVVLVSPLLAAPFSLNSQPITYRFLSV